MQAKGYFSHTIHSLDNFTNYSSIIILPYIKIGKLVTIRLDAIVIAKQFLHVGSFSYGSSLRKLPIKTFRQLKLRISKLASATTLTTNKNNG